MIFFMLFVLIGFGFCYNYDTKVDNEYEVSMKNQLIFELFINNNLKTDPFPGSEVTITSIL